VVAGRAGGRSHRTGAGQSRNGAAGRGRTVALPIAAALCVLVLLLWYSFAHGPASEGADAGLGANLGAALASAGPTSAAGGSGDAAVAAAPTGASGCQTGRTLPAGVSTQTLTVGGVQRSYLLAVPTGTPAGPQSLIINFHAAGQAPSDFESSTGMAGAATRRGYVVVDPTGVNSRWNYIQSGAAGPDDVAFVAAVLGDVRARGCLAENRVFATGLGDGADMAVAASCALPGRIAAVVSVAGSVIPASCANPVTNLFEIHGAEDQIAPWNGGGPARAAPFAGAAAQPVADRLGRYAQDTGCTAAPATEALPGLGQLVAWTCEGKPDVGALSVTGGGHTWPQAPARPDLGPTASSFSATMVSLLYFQAHPVVGAVVSPTSPSLAQSLAGALAGTSSPG
jgi:polyhydroxybutyrate depolymerase